MANKEINWSYITNRGIAWNGTGNMTQYQVPIRNNSPQTFLYTFVDENGNVIDLTGMVAFLEVKLQGAVFSTVPSDVLIPPTNGMCKGIYIPNQPGVWTAQFYVEDMSSNKLYGDPVQFSVFPNVEDLALTELSTY